MICCRFPGAPPYTYPSHERNTFSFQVNETIEWLSNYFLKLRLSKGDILSFGLLSKWRPYIEEVRMFWEYLIMYLIDLELNNCSKESVGSGRVVKGTRMTLINVPMDISLDMMN